MLGSAGWGLGFLKEIFIMSFPKRVGKVINFLDTGVLQIPYKTKSIYLVL